jgi:hypothetical protein
MLKGARSWSFNIARFMTMHGLSNVKFPYYVGKVVLCANDGSSLYNVRIFYGKTHLCRTYVYQAEKYHVIKAYR